MKLLWQSKWLIGLIILGGIGFASFKLFNTGQKSTARRQLGLHTLAKGDIKVSVTIAGNIVPEKKSIITAPFDGYINQIYVKVGQSINKGDPIVSISQSLQSIDPTFPLRSPFTGTVVQVLNQSGDFVKQSDVENYIVRIDKLDTLYIEANIAESDRVSIRPGQKVSIKAAALAEDKFAGEVETVSLASKEGRRWSNQAKVEFPSRIRILDKDPRLKPGMSVIIDIVVSEKKDVLLIPHANVFKKDDKYFVILENGERREIEVGLRNESVFEVKSGVTEGAVLKQIDFVSIYSETE